jgi:PhnB protein
MNSSIAPWLSVVDGEKAVSFYKAAFGAVESYRLAPPDGSLIVRLEIGGAVFWVSGDPPGTTSQTMPLGNGTIRMILTVADPDSLFTQAVKAGATEVFPVGEDHGWRLGRLADPFGLHWEIGYELGQD